MKYFSFFLIIYLFSMTLLGKEMNINDTVSPFAANDENGELWKLQDNLDKDFLVIYFFPAAMTGG